MLKISHKADYGLLLLTELSDSSKKYTSLSQVAKRRGLSPKFLEQVARGLKKAGLVSAKEGAGGGYRLARDPKDIRLSQVVTALEGPLAIADCLEEEGCLCLEDCSHRGVWQKVQTQVEETLAGYSLADLAEGR